MLYYQEIYKCLTLERLGTTNQKRKMLGPQQSSPLLPQLTTWRVVSGGESGGFTFPPLTTHHMTSYDKSCVNSCRPNIVHQKNMTFVDLRSARARQSSCRCPTENDIPAPFT